MKKQATSQELKDELLEFIQRKFYEGDLTNFSKDKRRLLAWVVLFPSTWLDERGVSVPAERYRDIFMAVMILALQQGNTANIHYRPAWLARVIQSHFAHHGDEIYADAKSSRSLTENALLVAGRLPTAAPADPMREMALAARLLATPKKKLKRAVIGPVNMELELL